MIEVTLGHKVIMEKKNIITIYLLGINNQGVIQFFPCFEWMTLFSQPPPNFSSDKLLSIFLRVRSFTIETPPHMALLTFNHTFWVSTKLQRDNKIISMLSQKNCDVRFSSGLLLFRHRRDTVPNMFLFNVTMQRRFWNINMQRGPWNMDMTTCKPVKTPAKQSADHLEAFQDWTSYCGLAIAGVTKGLLYPCFWNWCNL